jgi:hypothetical protein
MRSRHQYKTILKSVVWKFDILDSSLVVFKSTRGKNRNKPLWLEGDSGKEVANENNENHKVYPSACG